MSSFNKPEAYEVILRRIEGNSHILAGQSDPTSITRRITTLAMIQLLSEINIPPETAPEVIKRLEALRDKSEGNCQQEEFFTFVHLTVESIRAWHILQSASENES